MRRVSCVAEREIEVEGRNDVREGTGYVVSL
jgi:hypothetical protein